MAPSPVSPPKLDIPASKTLVKVSIIDTTTRLAKIPMKVFMTPEYPNFPYASGPAYSFLIEHPTTGDRLLFDLGVRKDWENMSPAAVKVVVNSGMQVEVEKNVCEILKENGVELSSVKSIIWSHRHFDHQGDPSTFPGTTSLTVGPGFRDVIGPGWPEKEDSMARSSYWKGRDLVELNFDTDSRKTMVGRYPAIDYFGDGSFYLLQTAGHTNDHLCGFARTKIGASREDDEFILMGGDISHHGGEYKPSKYRPIPELIEPDPRKSPWTGGVCPGHLFAEANIAHEGNDKWKKPFFSPEPQFPDNLEQAEWSIDVLKEFDASEKVLVLFAHDNSMLDVVECFPKPANDWREKGWKKEGIFRFLTDFDPEKEPQRWC